MLRKTIMDKQFLYLVLAVLQSIVSYRTQFSFVLSSVCCKWDVIVRKGLKSKAGKIAASVFFSNASGVLGHLFDYRFLDLQILGWASLNPLQFLVKLRVSLVNNFLAGIAKIFLSNELSLANNLPNVFYSPSSCFEVYTDESLRNAGSVDAACGATAYFLVLDKSVGVVVSGLLSSTLAELQAVALVLECVPSFCQVILHTNSQAAIDACLLELSCAMPDFRNWYWLEKHYIFNLVRKKDLEVVWVKVKSHSGISDNVKTDLVAGEAAQSPFFLLAGVHEHYLVADNTAISGNAHLFVRNIFRSINCAYWEAGPGVGMVPVNLIGCVNWISTAKVWHPDFHILAGFTGQKTLNLCSYLIKAVYRRLPVAGYPGILCLLCDEVKFSDHAFTCSRDVVIHDKILVKASAYWVLVASFCDLLSSAVLQTLSACSLDVGLYSIVCKGFVLNEWCEEAQGVFDNKKQAIGEVVNFVRFVANLYYVRA
ncbi:hypothetical protein G9A89_006313 [Geosiphon pyriformis]|nr:hypothetical protein G9A89_006313 [Geosiphon pyriformis]